MVKNISTLLNGQSDILLLSHFVTQSNSLRTNDQHWVPICMPGFNANGYLQVFCGNCEEVDKIVTVVP